MTQWYYVMDGEQAGPVDDATFRKWIMEGHKSRLFGVWLVFILLSLVVLTPFWVEYFHYLPSLTDLETAEPFQLSLPLWIWTLVAPILLGLWSWPTLAVFHRDLTPPVPENS